MIESEDAKDCRMQFGLYTRIPTVTVGSVETAQAVNEALRPLAARRRT